MLLFCTLIVVILLFHNFITLFIYSNKTASVHLKINSSIPSKVFSLAWFLIIWTFGKEFSQFVFFDNSQIISDYMIKKRFLRICINLTKIYIAHKLLKLKIRLFYVHFIFNKKFSTQLTLREKSPNTEFFLVCIFPYSVQIRENMDQKKRRIWTFFAQC